MPDLPIRKMPREEILNQLFNPATLASFREHGIVPTKKSKIGYREVIENVYKENPDTLHMLCLKKERPDYPWTLWVILDQPYITLPTPQDQRSNLRHSYSKPAISLCGNTPLRDRIWRTTANISYNIQHFHYKRLTRNLRALNIAYECIKFNADSKTTFHVFLVSAPGRDLQQWLKEGNISKQDALQIAHELCIKMNIIHDQQYVHFDTKPENVIYDDSTKRLALIDYESAGIVGTSTLYPMHSKSCGHPSIDNEWKTKKAVTYQFAHDVYGILTTLEFLFRATRNDFGPTSSDYAYFKTMLDHTKKAIYYPCVNYNDRQSRALNEIVTLPVLTHWLKACQTDLTYAVVPAPFPKSTLPVVFSQLSLNNAKNDPEKKSSKLPGPKT